LNAKRQRVKFVPLLLLGGALGAGLALPVARALHLRFSEEALFRYAQRILRTEEQSAEEARAAWRQFSSENAPFCSDEEIGAMRRFVYNAAFVKDLGREKEGYLYCTSGTGRLEKPARLHDPAISFNRLDTSQRVDVTPGNPLLLAPDSSGIVMVSGGVTIVLNPAFYAQFQNPPMQATWLIHDSEHNTVTYAFGHPNPLTVDEVLAGRLAEHDGIVYQPLCSARFSVCAVASESKSDMLKETSVYSVSFAVMAAVFSCVGALLGMLLVSTFLLYFHRQRSFERRLLRAVRQRALTCAYQPIVDLDSGAVVGVEALARWTTESNEAIPPDHFIAVAEERGFIGEITSLVMERVLADLAPLLSGNGFHATINIAASDLRDSRFFPHLEDCIRRAGISHGALGFEITERSTALQAEAKETISRLRAAGHLVYLDDFGTGYSSLAYLQDLHADGIKIDRVFTQTVGTEAVTASVLPHILDMASRLKLKVIVEGIEKPEQAEYFRREQSGIQGQGWLFGRPMPAAEFIALVETTRSSEPRPAD
jgi:sensor c-di-GMP phosphodiesterase-like protein